MADISTNIKERILYIAEKKGITKEVFFTEMGLSYGNFKGKSKKTPLNSDAIAVILTKYKDVNCEWLLLGKGEMIKQDKSEMLSEQDSLVLQLQERIAEQAEYIKELKDDKKTLKKALNALSIAQKKGKEDMLSGNQSLEM